ncbi:MAG: insulinase family protein, partial [Cyanobacteria bacterium]|nr:insulinase family protein [Cyanobacteriota bacterium]
MGGHPFYPPIQLQPGGIYPSASSIQGVGSVSVLGTPILKQSFVTPSGYPAQLFQLSNGHHVLLEQRKGALTSLRTFINTGSIHEDPIHPSRLYGKTGLPSGIAHLDEHCHFLTTQNFPEKNSWVKAVQKMGAQLNATTSPEWIQHELTFHQDDLFPMIAMHGEAVMRPKYEDGTIHQEKQNVINEAAERTQEPEAKMDSKLFELMFDRPAFQTLGKASDVTRTTARQLQQFYDTYYTPENMITVISGNFNPQQVLNAINQEFGKNTRPLHGDEAKGLVFSLQPGQVKSATIYDPKLTYSTAQLGFPGPHKSNFKERMAMELLMTYLTHGDGSLLNRRVKDQERCV